MGCNKLKEVRFVQLVESFCISSLPRAVFATKELCMCMCNPVANETTNRTRVRVEPPTQYTEYPDEVYSLQ